MLFILVRVKSVSKTSGLSNLIVSLSQGIKLASPKLDEEVVCDMFVLEEMFVTEATKIKSHDGL